MNADVAKKTANSAGVQGFPTVKLYAPDGGQRNPYGKFYKPAVDYQGARTARGVVDFATAQLKSLVVPVGDKAELASFRANGTLPKALLVSKKAETTPLLKSLSFAFKGRLLIGEARDTASEVVEALGGVADYPMLAVLPADGGDKIVYDGEMKPAALKAFLEQHAAAAAAAGGDGRRRRRAGEGDAGFAVDVDASNAGRLVEGERDAWLLVFAGTDGADLPTDGGVEALAEALNGQVKVGRAAAEVAAKFGVTVGAKPSVAVWPYRKAGKKRAASVHPGTEAGVAAAKKAALESLPSDGVTILHQGSLDRWMQESMATTETRAFCMLFSDKPTIPPLFRALALEFDGKMGFGMGQASDTALASRFNVNKAPTLLVMFPDLSKSDESGNIQLAGMMFDPRAHGKFNFGNIATFLDGFANMRKQQLEQEGGGGGGGGGGGARRRRRRERAAPRQTKDTGPPAELTASTFDAECVAKGGLCGIALLDGAAENAASKERSLEMLGKLKSRKAGGPISFSWIDATCHTSFMAAFELSEVDLPTMIYLSPQKLRWARSVGAFDVETLSAFGNAVAAGRRSTSELSALPALEEVDCATVARGGEGIVEDDGADDIMAEILEEERKAREAREAELAAEGAKAAAEGGGGGGKKKKEEMSKLEALEADVEECEAMDLLCSARREKQLKAVEKQRALEEKLAAIAKKKRKAKAKAKKAAKA